MTENTIVETAPNETVKIVEDIKTEKAPVETLEQKAEDVITDDTVNTEIDTTFTINGTMPLMMKNMVGLMIIMR